MLTGSSTGLESEAPRDAPAARSDASERSTTGVREPTRPYLRRDDWNPPTLARPAASRRGDPRGARSLAQQERSGELGGRWAFWTVCPGHASARGLRRNSPHERLDLSGENLLERLEIREHVRLRHDGRNQPKSFEQVDLEDGKTDQQDPDPGLA